jgi:YgiT-type zinc finger domain-containing protein
MNEKKYVYGRCEVCGETMKEKQIKEDFWIKDELFVIENVPAGVCQRCGEKIVNAEVGHRILKLLNHSDAIANAPKMSVPKLKYEAAELLS